MYVLKERLRKEFIQLLFLVKIDSMAPSGYVGNCTAAKDAFISEIISLTNCSEIQLKR